jgi:DNA-binding beta-propeller fold protein YncE
MKSRRLFSALALLISLASVTVHVSAQKNTSAEMPASGATSLNPLQVALLKWYKANTTTSFSVGNDPLGMAFDGANVWVANFDDGTVSKLRANDGSLQGTFTIGSGVEPYGVTYDGANIWVSNSASGTVTKLQGSTGKILGTFTVGSHPGWMAFDGANIWVPNGTSSLTKLRASDGKN